MEHLLPYVDNNIYSIGTDANGCTNTDAVDVTVNALPTVDAGADQSVCSGDAVTLTATSNATINWDNELTKF